jgi:L-lactate dehydrogenase complex protein LldG
MTAPATARDQILARIRAATGSPGGTAAGTPGGAATGSPGGAAAGAPGAAVTGSPGGIVTGSPGGAAAGSPGGAAGNAADENADAAYAALPREYLRAHHDPVSCDIVDLFAERAADYRAVVEQVPASGVAPAIARVLTARAAEAAAPSPAPSTPSPAPGGPSPAPGAPSAAPGGPSASPGGPFVVPDGLPAEWLAELPASIALASDAPPLSPAELDKMAGVVTGCAAAIAETGTIILDHGPGQGRRAVTLVPDFHLVIVRADQVAADLPDALAMLDPSRPHTLISGPSATSDIELIRVEGVHGPRTLHVLLASP